MGRNGCSGARPTGRDYRYSGEDLLVNAEAGNLAEGCRLLTSLWTVRDVQRVTAMRLATHMVT